VSESAPATASPRRERGKSEHRAGITTLVPRLITFIRQVVAELRKVIWPTRQELITYTSVVLVFVVIMVLIVAAFDFAFTQAVLAIFGK
jgi:preprotein translocase subunit SecE